MTLDGIHSKEVKLPTDTGDEKKTTELPETEKAAEQLTKHFSDLCNRAGRSMAENFKAQKKADPTKEQGDLDAETRKTRAEAHAADVEAINAIKKEAEEAALKNHRVKAVITPKTDAYGRTTYDIKTELTYEPQMPITDYAEQLTENPELMAEKTDGGTIYEDKNGRRAGYIRADGKLVVINNPDEHTSSVSYTDIDGDGWTDSETVSIK